MKDALFLIGAVLMAYGLYKIHPSLCFLFAGFLLWLTAYASFQKEK